MTSSLNEFVNHKVSVLTNDARHYVGVLEGFDQATNLMLRDSSLLLWTADQPVQSVPAGAQVIRGDTVAAVFLQNSEDLPETAEPLKPFMH